MSIETKIDELIAALNANTAALKGAGTGETKAAAAETKAAAAETKAEKTTKSKSEKAEKAEKAKSTHTKAEMHAAVNEVKEQFGTKVAKELIASVGFEKLAEVTDDKVDELYLAAKAKLEGGAGESDDGL